MNKYNLEQLRYLIGKFDAPSRIRIENIETWRATIATFPQKIAAYNPRTTKLTGCIALTVGR